MKNYAYQCTHLKPSHADTLRELAKDESQDKEVREAVHAAIEEIHDMGHWMVKIMQTMDEVKKHPLTFQPSAEGLADYLNKRLTEDVELSDDMLQGGWDKESQDDR